MENDSLQRESNMVYDKLNEKEKDAERLRKDLECLLNAKVNCASAISVTIRMTAAD